MLPTNTLPNDTYMVWSPTVEIQNHPVRVCGIASTGAPVIGLTYIVELLAPLPDYPYTHAAAFEVHLMDPSDALKKLSLRGIE